MKDVSEDYTLYKETQLDWITKKTVMFYDGASWIDISARIISIGSNSQRIEETLGNFEIGECKVTCDDSDGYFLGTGGKFEGLSGFSKKISIKQGYAGVSDDIKTFEGHIDYESVRQINNDRVEFKVLSYMSQLMLHAGNNLDNTSLKWAAKNEMEKAIDTVTVDIDHIPNYSGDPENFVENTISLESGEIGRDIIRRTINYGNATAEYYLITDSKLYKISYDEDNGKILYKQDVSDNLPTLETASGDWGDEYLKEMFFNSDQSYLYITTLRHHSWLINTATGKSYACDIVWRVIRYTVSDKSVTDWVIRDTLSLPGPINYCLWNFPHDSGDTFYFFLLRAGESTPYLPNLYKFVGTGDGTFTNQGEIDGGFIHGNAVISGTDFFAPISPQATPNPTNIPWRKYALADASMTILTESGIASTNNMNCIPVIDKITSENNIYARLDTSSYEYFKRYSTSGDSWTSIWSPGQILTFHVDGEDSTHVTAWRSETRNGGLWRQNASEEFKLPYTNDSDSAKASNLLKAWIIQVDPDSSATYDEYIWAYTEDSTLKIVRYGDEFVPHITKDYTNKTALATLKDMANDFNCLMFIRPKDGSYGSQGWFGYRNNVLDWANAGEITLDDNEISNKEKYECWDYYAKRIEYTAGSTTFGYGDSFPTAARTLKISSDAVADTFADDMAKYLYDWFHKVRKVIKVTFKKPHFHYEIFDYIKIDNKKYIMTELRRDKVLTATFLQAET